MSLIADSVGAEALRPREESVEARVFRAMVLVVAASGGVAAVFAPWRVTAGLVLGGLLSLLNYHWIRTSLRAVFENAAFAVKPRIGVVRYVLRYFVVAAITMLAYEFDLISLPAAIVGLCSPFVAAFFIEASRQSYYAFTGREEPL